MHDIDLIADRAGDAAQVRICRLDGSEVSVRLTRLRFDSCEFETDKKFAPNEQVNIHMHRMGWIRARITSVQPPLAEAEFAKDCLV
jgi:hypothetical protein